MLRMLLRVATVCTALTLLLCTIILGIAREEEPQPQTWFIYDSFFSIPGTLEEKHDVFQMRLDGRLRQRFLDLDFDYKVFGWTGDKKWVLITSGEIHPIQQLYRIRPGSRQPIPVLTDLDSQDHVWWSPDHKWLFFRRDELGQQLYRMRPDGSQVQAVESGVVSFETFYFSPDQKWLLFEVEADDLKTTYYRVRTAVSDLNAEFVTETPFNGQLRTWTPDARWMLVEAPVYSYENPDNIQLYRINIETGETQLLASHFDDAEQPGIRIETWSPDGEWLYYNTNNELYRIRPDGRDLQLLMQDPSPQLRGWIDDEWLLVSMGQDNGVSELYSIRSDGSDLRQLTHLNDEGELLIRAWDSDSEWIFFTIGSFDTRRFYQMHPDGSELDLIFPEVDYSAPMHLSSDETWLVFRGFLARNDRNLFRLRVGQNKPEPLTHGSVDKFLDWLPPIDLKWHIGRLIVASILLIILSRILAISHVKLQI